MLLNSVSYKRIPRRLRGAEQPVVGEAGGPAHLPGLHVVSGHRVLGRCHCDRHVELSLVMQADYVLVPDVEGRQGGLLAMRVFHFPPLLQGTYAA